jgi:hypothetical protein
MLSSSCTENSTLCILSLSYTVSIHPGCHPAVQTTPLCVLCLVIHSEQHPGCHPDVAVIQILGCYPDNSTAHVLPIVQVSVVPSTIILSCPVWCVQCAHLCTSNSICCACSADKGPVVLWIAACNV